jgi:predicted dehydrogenase
MADMPKPYKVLIVGVGSIGHRHLRCFTATGRVEPSICEPNVELRQQLAEEYHVRRTYADLKAALADRHDAAVIATPANLHVPMAIRLAEAGIHVLVEKPLSTSLEGIESLRRIVAQHAIVAAVAYVYHAHPVLRAMKAALAAGRFGRPLQLVAVCGQHFPT